jgi:hypothetical protein
MMFSLIDMFLMVVGNLLFAENLDFACMNGNTVIATNNAGAGFLIAYSFNLIMFSFMIWFVFYKIPEYYGLI